MFLQQKCYQIYATGKKCVRKYLACYCTYYALTICGFVILLHLQSYHPVYLHVICANLNN